MDQTALYYTLALSQVTGVGSVTGKRLITAFGSAQMVFEHYNESAEVSANLKQYIAEALNSSELWKRSEEEMRFIEKYRIRVLFFMEDDYPRRLADCYDSPVYLFYKGSADLNACKVVGIVGTRSATDYGKSVTRELVSGLREQGPLVVSGLAYGIDSLAHRAALECGLETVGVLGHGLDRIYPFNNRVTAEKMLGQGGLITEFFSCTRPDRENFPQRNRIIAGMCDAIVVVEAADEGGALITADIAHTYQKSVFAIPGRTSDMYSAGCNFLIKLKKAEIIRHAGDLMHEMSWKKEDVKPVKPQLKLFVPLTMDEQKVVELLNTEEELSVDEISRKTSLPVNKTVVALLNLELENVVRCKPGKVFTLSQLQAR